MCIASFRTYKSWDVFYECSHTGLHWTARRECVDGGHKLRADTLAGLKAVINEEN
jgi:hypothetical protein